MTYKDIFKKESLLRCLSAALLICAYFSTEPASLIAAPKEPQDIIFFDSQKNSRGKTGMPPAVFSHSLHKKNGVDCNNCHPDIFKPEKGSNNVSMVENINGNFCGACHMGGGDYRMDNWNMSNCEKCHKK